MPGFFHFLLNPAELRVYLHQRNENSDHIAYQKLLDSNLSPLVFSWPSLPLSSLGIYYRPKKTRLCGPHAEEAKCTRVSVKRTPKMLEIPFCVPLWAACTLESSTVENGTIPQPMKMMAEPLRNKLM